MLLLIFHAKYTFLPFNKYMSEEYRHLTYFLIMCVVNVQQTKSGQICKELCILRVHEKVLCLLSWSDLQKFTSNLPSFDNYGAHFPMGKIIYSVSSFGQWVG